MPQNGETITEDCSSSIDNLKIEDWKDVQMTNTLKLLNGECMNCNTFYITQGNEVLYRMDIVKEYLSHICKREDGSLKNYDEMVNDIRSENIEAGNDGSSTTSWIIAIQIALEYLGYDVGKIDGNRSGNTEETIKNFQMDNNLLVDGVPGPKVIESIITALNDKSITSKIRLRSNITVEKFQEDLNALEFEQLFKQCEDGTLEMTEKMKQLLNKTINELSNNVSTDFSMLYNKYGFNREVLDQYFENIGNLFSESIYLLIDNNKYGACEFHYQDGHTEIVPFTKGFISSYDEDVTTVKIIPNSNLGIDGIFLADADFMGNEDNVGYFNDIRGLGYTMEGLKPFFDEFIKSENIGNIKNLNFKNFFYDKLNSDVLKFVFGENFTSLSPILPINMYEGLNFYILKSMRGDSDFNHGIEMMKEGGLLDNRLIVYLVDEIINSNITLNELPEYIKKIKDGDRENFYWNSGDDKSIKHTPEEYGNIIEYMKEYGISYRTLREHRYFRDFEIFFRNKIPGDIYYFMENMNKMDENGDLIEELFVKNEGIELYSFLSKYPQILENLGGKEIKEIELTTKPGGYNFCFRGILEMIKSMNNIKIPNIKRDGEEKWKEGRELIIRQYESLLRNYISLDKDENGNEIPRDQTFDKVFFASSVEHENDDWNGAMQGAYKLDFVFKGFTKNFEDCSNTIDQEGNLDKSNQQEMIKKIRQYVESHPNDKILVYIGAHGSQDGSSSNGWEKENRQELASISPNIRIMSVRCYFGSAYTLDSNDKNYIYGLESPVLGFSNETPTSAYTNYLLGEGYEKGLGFHELQIYTRLHYQDSFTPLTEYMDYSDFRSGETRHGIVGLADAGNGNVRDDMA